MPKRWQSSETFVPSSPANRQNSKRSSTTDLDLQTMPTSRKIIPEVSGMSPNICQLCIKAVQQGGRSQGANASHHINASPS
ncbi:hypothetical protein EHI43_12320 [Rhizobium leguminosarum]|nr:hypothetical protein EHI43_12320 [Rhizobium leguminosarum]